MKKHEALIARKIIPGHFRCGEEEGLRVEVLDVIDGEASIVIGQSCRPSIGVDAEAAAVLRDFFADLAEIL